VVWPGAIAGRPVHAFVVRVREWPAVPARTSVQQRPGRHAPLPARARQLLLREGPCAHGAGVRAQT